MSRFIRLTNHLINTNFIHTIFIQKDKFIISLMSNQMDGFFMFGGGGLQTYNTEFEICKEKHPIDYKIFTDWIDNDLK